MTRAASDDQLLEQMAEEVDAHTGPFRSHFDVSWTGDGHYSRLERLIDGLVAAGHLRRLDLKSGEWLVRTDIECPLTEPVLTVYRLYDADDCLLYVGCTSGRVAARLKDHAKRKHWFGEVAKVTEQQVTGWQAALAVESEAIVREEPLYNIVGNPTRLPVAARRLRLA